MKTASEIAAVLEIDSSQVRRLARTLGVGQKLGHQWVFTVADTKQLMKRPKVGQWSRDTDDE